MSENPLLLFLNENAQTATGIGEKLRCISVSEVVRWESYSASLLSTYGIVNNDEFLLRQLVDPTHWNRISNEFTPAAFSDADKFGMSLNRLKYTTFTLQAETAASRVEKFNAENPEKPKKEFLGFAKLSCQELRDATSSTNDNGEKGARLFCIFDTALKEDKSHADLYRIKPETLTEKQHKILARRVLWDLAIKNLHLSNGNHVDQRNLKVKINN